MSFVDRYAQEYREALGLYLTGTAESALRSAQEIGRRAVAAGCGIVDVVSLHERAVASIMERQSRESRAGSFLIESLSAFEISHRSVDEANTALRRLNEQLEAEVGRIAHALHDQAGSILATATIELDMAAREMHPGAHQRLSGVRRLLD